jgi:HEAT repeat protein
MSGIAGREVPGSLAPSFREPPYGETLGVRSSRRGIGEPLYAGLAFIVFIAEGAALAFLTWAILFSRGTATAVTLGIRNALVGAITITAVCLAIVTASVVVFTSASARRERRRRQEVAAWTDTWQRVVAGDVDCPGQPLSSPAIAALLECRERAVGADAEQIRGLLSMTGVERQLADTLLEVSVTAPRRWTFHVPGGSRRLAASLDLLDDVARARIPEAVQPLLTLVDRSEPSVQNMALRAASRTIAAMRPGPERVTAVTALLRKLSSRPIGRTALDRALLLLEDAAEPLIIAVLRGSGTDPVLISSCLDSAGRLGLTELAPEIGGYIRTGEAVEVRAAALRALAALRAPVALSVLPASALADLRAALSDGEDIVRTQAARAAYLLPADEAVPALVALLGDRSWWVRRAAGNSLHRVPTAGNAALIRASQDNPDRFARDMAAQVLRDYRVPSPTSGPLVGGMA